MLSQVTVARRYCKSVRKSLDCRCRYTRRTGRCICIWISTAVQTTLLGKRHIAASPNSKYHDPTEALCQRQVVAILWVRSQQSPRHQFATIVSDLRSRPAGRRTWNGSVSPVSLLNRFTGTMIRAHLHLGYARHAIHYGVLRTPCEERHSM